MSNVFSVIMAGGIGSRFWPLSREKKPKQFLDILGTGKTLIQQTYERFRKISLPQNIFVVTNQQYKQLVKEQLPELPESNILLEPERRNTAPCIAYAAKKIELINPDAIMIVSPSDHKVDNTDRFIYLLQMGVKFIQEHNPNALLTLGIEPTRPETGYGYIQKDNSNSFTIDHIKIYKVKTFTEKPDKETAQIFFENKEFLWNSGIFIWSVKTILNSLKHHLPRIANEFEKITTSLNTPDEPLAIKKVYSAIDSISIDVGVMENESEVYVIPADFGWSDLGTWGSLYENAIKEKDQDGNVKIGDNIITMFTKNSFINVPDDKLVVVLGLENIIVAEADGMLLIADKNHEQFIRQIVHKIKVDKGDKYI
jgi:mannose-1-phosphate guanylyltransferase